MIIHVKIDNDQVQVKCIQQHQTHLVGANLSVGCMMIQSVVGDCFTLDGFEKLAASPQQRTTRLDELFVRRQEFATFTINENKEVH